jgi:hypothetical protein
LRIIAVRAAEDAGDADTSGQVGCDRGMERGEASHAWRGGGGTCVVYTNDLIDSRDIGATDNVLVLA